MGMAFCQHCGAEIEANASYCPDCGESVEVETEPSSVEAAEETTVKAPTGIKIICVLAGIGAIFSIIAGFAAGSIAGAPGVPSWYGALGPVMILLGLANFPMIYGLWTVKSWGWTLAMVLYGINILANLLQLTTGLGALVGLTVSIVIIWYIYSKRDLYASESQETVSHRTQGA